MVPGRAPFWVECKAPATVVKFPKNGHEKLQAMEHQIMRGLGAKVWVVGTYDEVDLLLDDEAAFSKMHKEAGRETGI